MEKLCPPPPVSTQWKGYAPVFTNWKGQANHIYSMEKLCYPFAPIRKAISTKAFKKAKAMPQYLLNSYRYPLNGKAFPPLVFPGLLGNTHLSTQWKGYAPYLLNRKAILPIYTQWKGYCMPPHIYSIEKLCFPYLLNGKTMPPVFTQWKGYAPYLLKRKAIPPIYTQWKCYAFPYQLNRNTMSPISTKWKSYAPRIHSMERPCHLL